MKSVLIMVFSLIASAALAQQATDPIFLQKVIASLQQQRNAATDREAVAQAQASALADEVTKLKAKVEELEKKTEPAAEPAK